MTLSSHKRFARRIKSQAKRLMTLSKDMMRRISTRPIVIATSLYRRFALRRVSIVGFTGSCGKTCTKELAAAVLSPNLSGQANRASRNTLNEIVRVIWRCKPKDDYLLQEVSIGGEQMQLGDKARLLRPKIGVVTNIGMDHISAFGSQEAIASEKAKLLDALVPDGVAILNADDPLVMQMQHRCPRHVMTYGHDPQADVRASEVSDQWPQRLQLKVTYDGQSEVVQTQLCGDQWVHSVLAAIATGIAMGIPFRDAAKSIANAEPFHARMCPEELPNGVTIIRDDWKAPLWTVPASLRFMRNAQARRKVAVIGTLSDYRGDAASKYVAVAEDAMMAVDHVVFVGPWASRCLRVQPQNAHQTLHAFANVSEAIPFLKTFLRNDDLVLLKGSDAADHLENIVPAIRKTDLMPSVVSSISVQQEQRADNLQVVVGLGNPGADYEGTPHNVGYEVISVLAQGLRAAWVEEGSAAVARAEWKDEAVWFVRLNMAINECGPAIRDFLSHHGLSSRDLILVQDDINLEVGELKSRMRGSSGGHKGVASIVSALQTEAIRRVKVGVGQPASKADLVRYVTNPFPQPLRSRVAIACEHAADRVLELISDPNRGEHKKGKKKPARKKPKKYPVPSSVPHDGGNRSHNPDPLG